MLIKKIKTDFVHEDERGTLVQLVRRGYSQVNVITSKQGVCRGGHYHRYNTEAFYIIEGKCKVTATKDCEEESVVFTKGDFFCIAPCVLHSFLFIEDSVLVSMYSLGVELDDNTKDIFFYN